jgi:hypothetical protein
MPSVDVGPGVDLNSGVEAPPSRVVPVQSVGLGGVVTPDQDSVLVNLVTYREQ